MFVAVGLSPWLSHFVLTCRLPPVDPLAPEQAAWEGPAIDALLEHGGWRGVALRGC